MVLPDNSTTQYLYQGNTVTVTDPAGKTKTFTMDAFGNLKTVAETDPTFGAVSTGYTYDVLNHLIGVSMPRGGNTQTRTFNYNSGSTVTGDLQSATNPETGTVTYGYNSNHMMTSKTDAKGQQFTYLYDNLNRLSGVKCCGGSPTLLRSYSYDSDLSGFSQNVKGHLASVSYASQGVIGLAEQYSYQPGGLIATKRLSAGEPLSWRDGQGNLHAGNGGVNLDVNYTYNTEGVLTSISYPTTTPNNVSQPGPSYTYTFDTLNRANGLKDANHNPVVSNVTYGPSNELLTINYSGISETRGYNSLVQLTSLVAGSSVNMTYPAGSNNGKISSQTDKLTGETAQFTYDSLNRLITAQANSGPSPWGQSYSYDGFGSLTAKTVTLGTAPTLSVTPDPATNRISGLGYDSNGNVTSYPFGTGTATLNYDVENHVIGGTANGAALPTYAYNAGQQPVLQLDWDSRLLRESERVHGVPVLAGWAEVGQYQISTYNTGTVSQPNLIVVSAAVNTYTYFRRRLLTPQDRLGSIGKYFPYGEEKGTSNPANDNFKFATYWRDSATTLDYANHRYLRTSLGGSCRRILCAEARGAKSPEVGIDMSILWVTRSTASIPPASIHSMTWRMRAATWGMSRSYVLTVEGVVAEEAAAPARDHLMTRP